MKNLFALKNILFFTLFFTSSHVLFSQENKIVAELHNLLLDNSNKEKVIQIRFFNISNEAYEALYKLATQSPVLVPFRKTYSSDERIASLHFTKSTDITTTDVKSLLNHLNISNAILNEKKVRVSELENYHFSPIEKLNNSERIEK